MSDIVVIPPARPVVVNARSGTPVVVVRAAGPATSGSGGVTDGDKGDVVISSGVWTIDPALLTAYGRTLSAAADAAAARTVLGLGTAATQASGAFDAAGAASSAVSTHEASATAHAAFTGDSGSGGARGMVPAPEAGDRRRFLRGDGTWRAIAGAGAFPQIAGSLTVTNAANLFFPQVGNATNGATATGHLYLFPAVLERDTLIDEVGVYVVTGVAGQTCRIGLYDTDDNWMPSDLVFDSGDISVASSSAIAWASGLNETVKAGRYWAAAIFSTASATVQAYGTAAFSTMMTTETLGSGSVPGLGLLDYTMTYGALPASLTGASFALAAVSGGRMAMIRFR